MELSRRCGNCHHSHRTAGDGPHRYHCHIRDTHTNPPVTKNGQSREVSAEGTDGQRAARSLRHLCHSARCIHFYCLSAVELKQVHSVSCLCQFTQPASHIQRHTEAAGSSVDFFLKQFSRNQMIPDQQITSPVGRAAYLPCYFQLCSSPKLCKHLCSIRHKHYFVSAT